MSKGWMVVRVIVAIILAIAFAILMRRMIHDQDIWLRKEGIRMAGKLGPGYNIGNDLDTYGVTFETKNPTPRDYEMGWHNPPVTEEDFAAIKKAGFNSVRIPVSWSEHIDRDNRIDRLWMDRVHEVVDAALKQDLYVILDTHHEEFVVPDKEHEDEVKKKLKRIWKQIANEFIDYDDRLIFEGLNEPRLVGTADEWTAGTPEAQEVIAHLNETFVKTVRNSGDYNKNRYLIVCGYADSSDRASLESVWVPEDDNKIIVAVHAYLPYAFTSNEGEQFPWDDNDPKCTEKIDTLAADIEDIFLSKDIPVVITEFGCRKKDPSSERLAWAMYYTDVFRKIGVPLFWWDDGGDYQILDRDSHKFLDKKLVNILTKNEAAE